MLQRPRGTADILPNEQKYWKFIYEATAKVCEKFGYKRLDTPQFESKDLFIRGVGTQTDIVQKETYTFQDKGNEELTLRAEGTAPACRAYIENGMKNLQQPVRLYYHASIFRYERPQSGRYREHHQFGIEAIGDNSPLIDCEVIQIATDVIEVLGIPNTSLFINSIGGASCCRKDYLLSLKTYYINHLELLCNDCNNRMDNNPLRLLDCKQKQCQPFLEDAPHSIDSLCQECRDHHEKLLGYLDSLQLAYIINSKLVRGLDYYNKTVFEIQPETEGSQNTIIGGGRYDGLIEQIGGQSTPGIGFGCGIERLILNLKSNNIEPPEIYEKPVVICHMGEDALNIAVPLSKKLRNNNIHTIIAPYGKSIRSQMRYASSNDSDYVVIIGEEEIKQKTYRVKDMNKSTEYDLNESDLINLILKI
ncbi:MAG: histidine--tRNA ligase [SAR202 cluster bacterium]|nr:histidine--tRNA ligase [SAR202 cluster bacterium]